MSGSAGGRGARPHALPAPRPRAGPAGARVGEAPRVRSVGLGATRGLPRRGADVCVRTKLRGDSDFGAPRAAGSCFTQNDQRGLEGEAKLLVLPVGKQTRFIIRFSVLCALRGLPPHFFPEPCCLDRDRVRIGSSVLGWTDRGTLASGVAGPPRGRR